VRSQGWMERVGLAWRSIRVTIAASRIFGRSAKLRRTGRTVEALETARRGLAILRAPSSHRCTGLEGPAAHSTQAMLTIQVEQLSHELNTQGAEPADLAHVAAFLRSLPPDTRPSVAHMRNEWLPYLDRRLAEIAGDATDVAPEDACRRTMGWSGRGTA